MREGWLRRLGPGLIFAGTCVGVSHIVQSTRAGQSFLSTAGRQPRSFFGMLTNEGFTHHQIVDLANDLLAMV